MKQEEVRLLLITYLKNTGIKQLYICDKLGIPDYILSRFKKGTKDLYEDDLEKLREFLIQ